MKTMVPGITRLLSVGNLGESAFLFGCRQAGKTWLIENTVDSDLSINLLQHNVLLRYTREPELLYAEIEELQKDCPLIAIDEIQKAPGLLNEVHRAIEAPFRAKFLLTGSSARKLKRSHANMLGGRAITLRLFPLSYREVQEDFSLIDYLQYGGLPRVYLADSRATKKRLLESYVTTYLKEEIIDEALTRNIPAFTRFFDLAGFENGKILNYSAMSSEIGVAAATIKDYFGILEDTLLGFHLQPYHRSHRKRIVKHPKFYFFDTGMVFAFRKMLSIDLSAGTPVFGDAFEHFVVIEIVKGISYLEEEIVPSFFRTFDGAEVDLILEKHGEIVAVEIKPAIDPQVPPGLRSFLRDHVVRNAYCVCRAPRAYTKEGVSFIPWQDFVERLHSGVLFS